VKKLRRAVYDKWVKIDKPADGKPKWKPKRKPAADRPVKGADVARRP
jgi:hypothetical protein